ncbi:MAG: hypothetical protein OEQ13_12460, partial [Acidobacteriota bacterium]|nr:hypothetical protein [Acidobacteriota bacterium]
MAEPGNADRDSATIYLIDGTYTVFRSFFAIGRLSAPDGTPTSGVFGLVNTIRKLVRDREPDHLAVAFDLEGPTHRDEVFEQYKANRPEPPPELIVQFPLAVEACNALGWPDVSAPGYEADDVIATLAHEAREAGFRVVIVTSDKDLYQLVDEQVVVLNPAKEDRILDADGVEEVFGVRPGQVVDVLALMGDTVDNVPGVPGVGEKTAKALVRRYGGTKEVARRARLFKGAWTAHEEALAALEADDEPALADALSRMAGPAGELARIEADLGGTVGEDLAARFGAAAALQTEWRGRKTREVKRDLKALEKKTQPKSWLAIADNEELLNLSRHLVTLSLDAPVALDLEGMRVGPPDASAAAALFKRLGFRRLKEEMEGEAGARDEPVAGSLSVEVLSGEKELHAA